MNSYLLGLLGYFENVLHPASGWADKTDKQKRKAKKSLEPLQYSPDSLNLRGVGKKQDKFRRNPAP